MKKTFIGLLAVAAMAMVGCTQEELLVNNNEQFSATIVDNDESRTQMGEGGKVIWSENDAISLFMKNGYHYQMIAKKHGSANTDFAFGEYSGTGTSGLDMHYAIYPFEEGNTLSANKTFTVDLTGLSNQTYTEGNFQNGLAVMTAKSTNTRLPFFNTLSMLRVRLNAVQPGLFTVTNVKIESASSLSGTATIDMTQEKPIAKFEGNGKTITLDCANGVAVNTDYVDFFILTPAQTIPSNDFTITITGTNAMSENSEEQVTLLQEKIEKSFTFERAKWVTYERTLDGTFSGHIEPGKWDGTIDISWYDAENPKTEYTITTAEQLAGLAELVSGDITFEGVTFKLESDLDLYCEDTSENADGDPVTFRPIGDKSKDGTFKGTFDGQGHTIENLYQNGWDLGYEWGTYGSYGLFGIIADATIKNLTIKGTESYIEGGDVSFVAGSATGTCVFEDITIEDGVSATYNNGNGGIIGWSGAGSYTFKNITIKEDVVLAGLWGSFDSSIGGIVGQAEPGATYNFENVEINCRLDVYNDCTASYDYYNYRMCGMIIGRCEETTTIDGANYPDLSKYNITCTNVTVTYGDWMNYHYCEPTPGLNGGRGMRVEPGYSYDGLPADYDHSQCVDNHMNLIPFDQLIGGDQLGVKGLRAVTGVTVNYPEEKN